MTKKMKKPEEEEQKNSKKSERNESRRLKKMVTRFSRGGAPLQSVAPGDDHPTWNDLKFKNINSTTTTTTHKKSTHEHVHTCYVPPLVWGKLMVWVLLEKEKYLLISMNVSS